jgi:hypothetical protein
MAAEPVLCKICHKRRAKRACPAVGGDICTICCGSEREVSLACPLDCEYLQEAHRREKTVPIAEADLSNPDVRVTEDFVAAHEELLLFSVYSLLQATLHTAGAVDTDVLEALAGLIRTHRTLESGLVYESYSPNTIAAAIQRGFSASLRDYQKLKQEREALAPVRNSEIIATLVFLHRVGQQNLNGRPRGRMFIDLLRHMTPDAPVKEAPASGLIV